MDAKREKMYQEIGQYIKKYLRKGSFKLPNLFMYEVGALSTPAPSVRGAKWALDFLLTKMELSFSEKLMQLIDDKGRKHTEIYTKAGVTKAHFSKIKADKDYRPTKETALAFSIALHLDLDETNDLLRRAGYTISHSSEKDLIVEFFITKKIYNIDEINCQLDMRGHKPLTNWRKTKEE